jgi:hypothetical protein
MTFNHANRRLHLYLALGLLPWFFIYGFSSIYISHGSAIQRAFPSDQPVWSSRSEQSIDLDVPSDGNLRTLGKKILSDLDLAGPFYIARRNFGFQIYRVTFLHHVRITYRTESSTLRAEDRRFGWREFFGTLHTRGGFQEGEFLHNTWSVIVDIVCVGILLWITRGLIMWWQLIAQRKWGIVALGGGFVTFFLFMLSF